MSIKDDFLLVETIIEFGKFMGKYPKLKLIDFDDDMLEHFQRLNIKWDGPREINGMHYDIRRNNRKDN